MIPRQENDKLGAGGEDRASPYSFKLGFQKNVRDFSVEKARKGMIPALVSMKIDTKI